MRRIEMGWWDADEVADEQRDIGFDVEQLYDVEMAESREDERAISKDIDGGEMLENGEVKNTPLAYLDMMI